jgi:hypothetical protein
MRNNYALKILQDEERILRKVVTDALNSGKWHGYSEALKDRKNKLKQLNNAIKTLQEAQGTTYKSANYNPLNNE